jgi:Flp pilus assembly protein CpaB
MAAINASTVFAITLAIIAGLICAWVFKTVFLTPKPKPITPAPLTYRATVLAANVTENSTISAMQVKRVTVDKETWEKWQSEEKDRGEMLTGNQAVGRIPKVALTAEKPVYTNDLLPLHYPEELSKRLEAGKVAAIVEVPSKFSQVREKDRVDLLCTLSNTDPDLGPTETRTATMVHNARVIARFGTTSEAARPSRSMASSGNHTYTLEVTPYRYALIELAKQIGGAFTLRIHDKASSEAGVAAVAAKGGETEDPVVERVGTDELAKLFGFARPLPPRYFEIEKFSGVDQVKDAHIFLEPGSPAPSTSSSDPRQNQPGMTPGGLQGPNQGPGRGAPPGGGRPRQAPGGGRPPSGNRQASLNVSPLLSADLGLTASRWQLAGAAIGDSDFATSGRVYASETNSDSYLAQLGREANYDTGLSTSNWRRTSEANGTTGLSTSGWRRISEPNGITGLSTSGWRRIVSESGSNNQPGMPNAGRSSPGGSGYQGGGYQGGGNRGSFGGSGGLGSPGLGTTRLPNDCPACRGGRPRR